MDEKFSDLNLDGSLADQIGFDRKDVLEVGSGSGGFTLKYLTDANSILAVDPDYAATAELHRQWSNQTVDNAKINLICGSIAEVWLPENSFDIAVFSHSF